MIIARKTRDTNIAEYVLYMYQVEDIIRAHRFDSADISDAVINQQTTDDGLRSEYMLWYENLIAEMKSEGITEIGHLNHIVEIHAELFLLHNTLVNIVGNQKYLAQFNEALPVLLDYQSKAGIHNLSLIETGFHALYTKLMMRLKKHAISKESEQGFDTIARWLGYLAQHYKKMRLGDLNFTQN